MILPKVVPEELGAVVMRHDDTRDMQRWAIYSPCEKYRYVLGRSWDSFFTRTLTIIALNPSTATESQDDPTIRRCIAFARRWQCNQLIITNIFAYRATDPKVMKKQKKPIGPANDMALLAYTSEDALVVCAWGNHGEYLDRGEQVRRLLAGHYRELYYLALTQKGQPQHPLYLPRITMPMRWRVA